MAIPFNGANYNKRGPTRLDPRQRLASYQRTDLHYIDTETATSYLYSAI